MNSNLGFTIWDWERCWLMKIPCKQWKTWIKWKRKWVFQIPICKFQIGIHNGTLSSCALFECARNHFLGKWSSEVTESLLKIPPGPPTMVPQTRTRFEKTNTLPETLIFQRVSMVSRIQEGKSVPQTPKGSISSPAAGSPEGSDLLRFLLRCLATFCYVLYHPERCRPCARAIRRTARA